MKKHKFKRLKPEKTPNNTYVRIWSAMDGAVIDCFRHHPEYFSQGISHRTIRNSLVKRATGTMMSFLGEPAKGQSKRTIG